MRVLMNAALFPITIGSRVITSNRIGTDARHRMLVIWWQQFVYDLGVIYPSFQAAECPLRYPISSINVDIVRLMLIYTTRNPFHPSNLSLSYVPVPVKVNVALVAGTTNVAVVEAAVLVAVVFSTVA